MGQAKLAKDRPTNSRIDSRTNFFRVCLLDTVLVNVALVLSIALMGGTSTRLTPTDLLLKVFLPINLVAIGVMVWRKLYRNETRYFSTYDFINLAFLATMLSVSLKAIDAFMVPVSSVQGLWALPVLFGFLVLSLLGSWRLYRRIMMGHPFLGSIGKYRKMSRVLIVGAADAGEALLRDISRIPGNYVVGFVDDDLAMREKLIHGVGVLGGIDDMADLIDDHDVTDILIAMPQSTGPELKRIFEQCRDTSARIRTLPSLTEMMSDKRGVLPLMRELQVEDLLRRDTVITSAGKFATYISGERVLITGGGGSIGSELARQVAEVSPATLILMGKGENSIFEVDQELRQKGLFSSTPVICDVRDRDGIDSVMKAHRPNIVFHAAAHKHVPLMEAVPIEAIQNNVFGTLAMAEAASRYGCKKFILVSTDKAVLPSSIMGATKRVAEMIVSSMATRSETGFAAVRFGNVLGSRGSLIPILKKQIARGGPITITHPEMTRYFMTIPEAAQLIMRAGEFGERGEMFILDMGEPVKIIELAKDMIRMHGLVPGQDIEISFTGMRPGEKLHEELSYESEKTVESQHPKIKMVDNKRPIEWDWLKAQLDELRHLCDTGDVEGARAFLMELAWGKNLPPSGVFQSSQTQSDAI